jgi:hypothetical protein
MIRNKYLPSQEGIGNRNPERRQNNRNLQKIIQDRGTLVLGLKKANQNCNLIIIAVLVMN